MRDLVLLINMAEEQVEDRNSSSVRIEEDRSSVIILEGYNGSLQGLKPVDPGVSSGTNPLGRNSFLPGPGE